MKEDQRRQVEETAKYLRNVRPLDPDEIVEYVEGQPHPAVVGQVLSELAPTLGLVERADGTFAPVSDDPIAPEFQGVDQFPESHSRRLEDLLVGEYGPDWHRGDSGDALRETIRRIKEDYFAGEAVEYDYEVALAYAIYHLPDYYAVGQYVLDELGRNGLLPRHLRVLDVGAGVGGPALGLLEYVPDDVLVAYHAVEPSDAADVLDAMLSDGGRNVHATVHRERAETFDPRTVDDAPDAFDLVVFGNVLSELDDPVSVARTYREYLAESGALVAIAPADLQTSTTLRTVERALADDLTVFSPTLRLWPGESPSDRGWSFDVKPDLAVPPFQRRLDEAGTGDGEFVNVDVQYSYAILRPDGVRRLDFEASPDRFAKMASLSEHVTNRVDVVGVKLSHDLSDGENSVYKVGDGSEREGVFSVLARQTGLNRDLTDAEYGDVLVIEQVLVLWNDDEDAFNLVVDEETIVDRIPAP